MRAGLRWTIVLLGGGLALAPASALAQSTAGAQPATTAAPPSDAIGPSELQNFSLKGSVTKPADQAPAPTVSTAPPTTTTPTGEAARSTPPPARRVIEARPPMREAATAARPNSPAPTPVVQTAAPAPAWSAPAQVSAAPAPAPALQPTVASLPSAPAGPLAPDHQLSILPWLLAALALAAGMFFLLWRRRSHEAFAGGPEFELFVPPEPTPTPRPTPAPTPRAATPQPVADVPKAAPPVQKGIVATRLRPQVEIAVQPLSCHVDGEQVTLEFELELFNAGAAPARAVLAETALFNAGAAQDQQLGAFFAQPVGTGERLDAIPPMKRVTFASRVVAPRSAIQEYELAGRKTIIPVLAFNALYEWSGGHAQTSAAYLVGRETKSDKLGPLGVNGASREFRDLAAHVLPAALRT